mgnify:CR=1 FL=1
MTDSGLIITNNTDAGFIGIRIPGFDFTSKQVDAIVAQLTFVEECASNIRTLGAVLVTDASRRYGNGPKLSDAGFAPLEAQVRAAVAVALSSS